MLMCTDLSSEFLEDHIVEEIRTLINSDTTYPAAYVCLPL